MHWAGVLAADPAGATPANIRARLMAFWMRRSTSIESTSGGDVVLLPTSPWRQDLAAGSGFSISTLATTAKHPSRTLRQGTGTSLRPGWLKLAVAGCTSGFVIRAGISATAPA